MPVIGEDLVVPFTIGGSSLGPFTQRLIEALEPWMTPSLEIVCESVGALGFDALLELIEEEGSEGEPGWVCAWGKLLDPDLCPAEALPYLGQYVGVTIPVGTPEAEARALVKAKGGTNRGTEAAVVAAIESSISRFWMADTEYLEGQLLRHETTPGSLTCYEATADFTSGSSFATTHLTEVPIGSYFDLIPRTEPNGDSNAYWFLVVVNGANLLPENSPTQLEANVNAVKYAGLKWEAVVTDEAIWDEATLTWDEVGAGVIWSTVTKAQIT
jgi:hypothetical protein